MTNTKAHVINDAKVNIFVSLCSFFLSFSRSRGTWGRSRCNFFYFMLSQTKHFASYARASKEKHNRKKN